MATPNGKPRGYFQRGLALDCETTGLCFKNDNPIYNERTGERHQTVSWGLIVFDTDTLKPIDELYVEIKWNDKSIKQRQDNPQFGKKAEEIHGLTRKKLEEQGVSEEEAVMLIANLIIKYWGPSSTIRTLGHNVHMFDLPFFKDLLDRHDIHLDFGNRHVDTNSIGFSTVGSFTSDDLFGTLGLEERGAHNALDDAHMALESARRIRVLWKDLVGINAYDE